MPKHPAGRRAWLLAGALLLAAALAAALYLSRTTTLSVAVAPKGGTEPALLRAFAEALATRKTGLRLTLVPFDGVRESAEALQAGTVDLAVVRPDVLMPADGLTVAVLREQAILVAAPETAGIGRFPDLSGKRLGMPAHRIADLSLVRTLVAYYGLTPLDEAPDGSVPDGSVALVPVEEDDLAGAFAQGRIDAVAMLTTPTSPAAQRIVGLVRAAAADGAVGLFGVPDTAALTARLPRLQAVTVPAGLFGGAPRLPADDLPTIGASYRLMARSGLSRSVAAELTQHLFEARGGLSDRLPAADSIAPPAYETTAAATSARLPNHPGAIDYFEREQESFIERYETWIYLLFFFGGGLGSAGAWLRQRLSRIRRERIEVATRRLLDIRSKARRASDPDALRAMAAEVDDLAAAIARHALKRTVEPRMLGAATLAIDAARSTVRRAAGPVPPAVA